MILKKLTRRLHWRYTLIRIGTPNPRRPLRKSAKPMHVSVTPRSEPYMMRRGLRRIFPGSISRGTISSIMNSTRMTYSTCSSGEGFTGTWIIGSRVGGSSNSTDSLNRERRRETQLRYWWCNLGLLFWSCSLVLFWTLQEITLLSKLERLNSISRTSRPHISLCRLRLIDYSKLILWVIMALKNFAETSTRSIG